MITDQMLVGFYNLSIISSEQVSLPMFVISGLSRLERWERAKMLGLNPDPVVKKIINEHSGDSRYTERYVPASVT